MSDTGVAPFRIAIPQVVLEDLRARLLMTRWPDEVDGAGWDYGTNLAYLRELVEYWQDGFDWRQQEARLNAFAHYRLDVDGLGLHFIHERGRGPNPMPLVLTHGWPSTFYELTRVIPLLTDPGAHGGDPAQSFHVVVPSLPGYGFSDRPRRPGLFSGRIADLWARLMGRLGYERFAAFGGDIGAGVTSRLGLYHPDRLLGIYVLSVLAPYRGPGASPLSEAEQRFVALNERWEDEEGAYSHQQSTRPQTLAYGLNDSPAGLAAWIVEKFRAWGDTSGDVETRFSRDDLLTTVTLYWVTQTINSSMRLYYEYRRHARPLGPEERVRVPSAIGLTTEAVDRAPREWAARTYSNLQRWTEFPRGGHFFALEEPGLLVDELRAFFKPSPGTSIGTAP